MPHEYVSPNEGIYKSDQFYWDSYFIILGLVKTERLELAKGMVNNLLHLYKRFGIIPMRNRYYDLGTSQIPFLTSMALEIYQVEKDKSWLMKVMKTAESELKNYWMNHSLTEKHIIYKELSRYCDHFITHLGAEHESGWDMTSRFHDRCLDYLPVDLNACLYKYEADLADVYRQMKNYSKAAAYDIQAKKRKKTMMKLMWNDKKKFFFDYNYRNKSQNEFYSVAGFYPLWAKLASNKQARMIRAYVLPLFETEGGLTNTLNRELSDEIRQHDYPNGWAPQQWIVIQGLLNYGMKDDAERIAKKWIEMNAGVFRRTGKFWEKYDVVRRDIGVFNAERYPTQSGFSWTNAIFVRLIHEFGDDAKHSPG